MSDAARVILIVLGIALLLAAALPLLMMAGMMSAMIGRMMGGAMMGGPWLMVLLTLLALAVGLAIAALSLPLGSVRERYACWDRYVAWPAQREEAAGGA